MLLPATTFVGVCYRSSRKPERRRTSSKMVSVFSKGRGLEGKIFKTTGSGGYHDGETQEVPNPAWSCDKTPHMVWGPQGPWPAGKPRFALPTLSECPSPNLPHHAHTHTHTHTHTHLSQLKSFGYHNRASSRGYGGLAEQSTQVRKPTAEKMVPRSRNERALWQGRAPPAG